MPVDVSREPARSPEAVAPYPFRRTIAFVVGFAAVWAILQFIGNLMT